MYNMKPYLEVIDQVIEDGPFKDTWESLSAYKVPQWYKNNKFGIFIHWGLYSVPAFNNEWYSRNMYIQGTEEFEYHVKTFGPHKEFGYKADKFVPDAWAELFA